MISLYIIPSGEKNGDREKTARSFLNTKGAPFYKRIVDVENVDHIIDVRKKSGDDAEWYCVMYDNEHITKGVQFALPVYLISDSDVLILIKNESGYFTQSPRFFKKHVKLRNESLLPTEDQDLKYTRIMDGWVKPHVLG